MADSNDHRQEMKPVFTRIAWLALPLTFPLFATIAEAQSRTVKLTVNVVSLVNWKPEPAAGANVTLTPSTGGPALHRETSGDGSVTVDVPVGVPGFGEGWLFSEPSIQVAVEKDSQTGVSTVNVRAKDFKTTSVIEMVRTVTLSPPPAPLTATSTTRLIVRVTDEMGNPISGASVNITRDTLGPEFQYGSSIQTGTDGVASTDIAIYYSGGFKLKDLSTYGSRFGAFGEGWLYAPTFDLEVTKESLSRKDSFKLIGGKTAAGFRYPESVTRTVILRIVQGKKEATIYVAVDVQDEDHNSIEGATVVVWDTSIGNVTGRFPGRSGSDGRATIPVVYGSLKEEESLPVEVSKSGYRQKKIFVDLKANQAGQTVFGGIAALEKNGPGGTKVTLTVLNNKNNDPVGGARVVLDGGGSAYYSDTTGGIGTTTFEVAQSGTLKVEISHDDYQPYSGEIRVLQDQPKSLPFRLEPKANKTQGEDTIEVTVLGKDSTDEKSKPAPIKGAYVKAGTISAQTEGSGVATLTAEFAENQEVTVQANGYKTKTQNVPVNKILHMSAGSAKTTFTLDPELSDSSPIRLSIEVRDISGKPVPKAKVDISTSGGEYLTGDFVGDSGNFLFDSSQFEQELSVLRKGLVIDVKRQGYKEVGLRSVPADMLKPSTKTGEFIVSLDRDWTDFSNELAALEEKVNTWKNDRNAGLSKTAESDFIDKALTLRKHAQQLLKEIEAAKETFGISTTPGGVDLKRCRRATELKEDIQLCDAEANQEAEEVKRLLDAGAATAASCSGDRDVDLIKQDYRDAIKLIAEIGKRNKKAVKDRDELMTLATEGSAATKLLSEMDGKIAAIGEDKKTADENASKAAAQYAHFNDVQKGLNARRIALYREFFGLKVKYDLDHADPPSNLQTRVTAIENTLNPRDTVARDVPQKQVPENVSLAPEIISGLQADAQKFLNRYSASACKIDTMDEMVNGIDKTLRDTSFEIGLAADLPQQADACAAKIAKVDQVTVPDVSLGGDDAAALLAAAAPFTGTLVATNNPPPAGTTKLFSNQLPLAGTKANPKTKQIQIFIYQLIAEAAKSPPPSAEGDLITVPDVSGFNDPDAMLAAAGPDMIGMIVATNKTPPKGSTKLFDHQDPLANTKSERGKPLRIFIYQSLADASSSPTGASSTTTLAPGAATANGRIMPSLIGHTIDEASALLPAGVRIGSDEIGKKPLTPAEALTIYYQYPPANQVVEAGTSVRILRHGEAESTVAASTPEPASDSEPDSSTKSGPTDITNTTGGEFWKGKTPPANKPTATKKAPPPPNKKKKTSDWWRQHGHDRPDYEVPNN